MIVPDTFRGQLAASCVTSVTRNISRYRKFAKRKNCVVVAKIVASFVARMANMAKNYASYLLQTNFVWAASAGMSAVQSFRPIAGSRKIKEKTILFVDKTK